MAIDSQRNARPSRTAFADASSAGSSSARDTVAQEPADAWLAPVLIGGGLLSPDQLAQVRSEGGPTLWSGITGSGRATDGQILEVVEAVDGLDALDRLEQDSVGLVLLDVDMPRLDGLGVLEEELRAQMRTASLPVIILTAHHGDTEEKALDLGAHDYLTKPVQTRSLVARVRAVLKRASMC
jgi:CheY-like chemotaxis protein